MTVDNNEPIIRRLEALERATEKRLDDARDIHRREHESDDTSHLALHQQLADEVERRFTTHDDLHTTAEAFEARAREAQQLSGSQFLRMYEDRWSAEKDARTLAAQAVDKRLEQMNEFRSQLQAQAATFVTNAAHAAAVEGIQKRLEELQTTLGQRFSDVGKHTDDRYEDNRKRIENLEKGDVKQEGRSLGQGAVIAIIVTAIGIAGTILGIIITLANVATGT